MDNPTADKASFLETGFIAANVIFFAFYIFFWTKVITLFSDDIAENDGLFLYMIAVFVIPVVYSIVTLIYVSAFKIQKQKLYDRFIGVVWVPTLIGIAVFAIKWFY